MKLLLVIATVDDDLAANFTGGKVHGVKVHIARSLVDGAQSAGEVSGGNPLCRGAGNVRRSEIPLVLIGNGAWRAAIRYYPELAVDLCSIEVVAPSGGRSPARRSDRPRARWTSGR